MAMKEVRPRRTHAGVRTGITWLPAFALALVLFMTMTLTHRIVGVDDAFISYRYAENLVRFGQFVFNQNERVEGATNLLWILILAGLRCITDTPMDLLSTGLSLALILLVITRSTLLLQMMGLAFWKASLGIVAVYCLSDVFLMMTTGLESGLYVALLVEAFIALFLRKIKILGLLAGFLFMTRPEGIVTGGLLIISLTWPFSDKRTTLWAAGPALLIVGMVTLWRLIYFHSFVPNSILDKSFDAALLPQVVVGMSLPYLASFAVSDPILIVIVCSCCLNLMLMFFDKNLSRNRLEIASLSIVLSSFFVVLRNGGDWMPHYRLLTQYAPAYCVLTGLALQNEFLPIRTLMVTALTIGSAFAIKNFVSMDPFDVSIQTKPPAGIFSVAAEVLEPLLKSSDVVSAEAAGLLPYRLLATRIHDPVGLMDRHIARLGKPAVPYGKTDIEYTFKHVRPSFMVWHWSGHIFEAPVSERSLYDAYCYARCEEINGAAILLVRKDRLDDAVRSAFRAWPSWRFINDEVSASTNRIMQERK